MFSDRSVRAMFIYLKEHVLLNNEKKLTSNNCCIEDNTKKRLFCTNVSWQSKEVTHSHKL